MTRLKTYLLCCISSLGMWLPIASHAQSEGILASALRSFPAPELTSLEFYMTLTKATGHDVRVGNSWYFYPGDQRGEISFQNTTEHGKTLNFTYLDEAEVPGDIINHSPSRTTCENSHGKMQCWTPYDWQVGRNYRILVTKQTHDRYPGLVGWSVSLRDLQTDRTMIGALFYAREPYTHTRIVLVEDLIGRKTNGQPSTDCRLSSTVAKFDPATANSGTLRSDFVSPDVNDCKAHVIAKCTSDLACVLSINDFPTFRQKTLVNDASRGCASTLGNVFTMQDCIGDADQLFSHDDNDRLHAARDPNRCLTARNDELIVLASCNNNVYQRWLQLSGTQAFMNIGNGRCMQPRGIAQGFLTLSTLACDESRQQRWHISP